MPTHLAVDLVLSGSVIGDRDELDVVLRSKTVRSKTMAGAALVLPPIAFS
jgi:hypothetical protein